MQKQKRKLNVIKLFVALLFVSSFHLKAEDSSSVAKTKIHNVVNFASVGSFMTQCDFYLLSFLGVEKPLDSYTPYIFTKKEAEKYAHLFSRKLIEESLGLTDSSRASRIRKIVFGLENYCLQIYGSQKGNHKVIHIAASRIGEIVTLKEMKDSLIHVDGGGVTFVRGVIEYRNEEICNLSIVLNAPF